MLNNKPIVIKSLFNKSPEFRNLVSVPQLNKLGFTIIFSPGMTYIVKAKYTGIIKEYVHQHCNPGSIRAFTDAYPIHAVDTTLAHSYYTAHKNETVHEELGHMSVPKLQQIGFTLTPEMKKRISQYKICKGVKYSSVTHKHPATHLSSRPLETVHIDPAVL